MSINSAMIAGVAGLASNSTALAVISDNIANVNTVGFKRNDTSFARMVTKSSSGGGYSSGGVSALPRALIADQGLLQNTGNATDLAISGDGFFVVSQDTTGTGGVAFTRAGAFVADAEGFLRNSAGYYLQGWPVSSNGAVNPNPSDLSFLEPININQLGGTAEQTTDVTINGNLLSGETVKTWEATYNPTASATNMASGNVPADFTTSVQVIDSKGDFRTVTISALKSSVPNEWHAEMYISPTTDIQLGAGLLDGQLASGTLAFTAQGVFDPANSTLPTTLDFLASTATPGAGQFAWETALGIDAQSITFDLGQNGGNSGFTQFAAPSAVDSTLINGAVFGDLKGVSVSEDGFVMALFDNGITREIYQIPVATFVNPNGLEAIAGNSYSVTNESGPFNLKQPGVAGAGLIANGSLESSTVDLAEEFTGLITTQRAYSASTKIITTADEMLEELIRIKR